MATTGCAAACLNTAGRGGLFSGVKTGTWSGEDVVNAIKSGVISNKIQEARIKRTLMFFSQRELFMNQLVKEITAAIKLAKKHNLIPVFRLNGTSDIRWETVKVGNFPNIMAMFPDVTFYDYTKIPNRRGLPQNYHLTFSLADGNDDLARRAIENGMNVAVVFAGKTLPETFMGLPVINGDETDLRFLDPKRVIVGLKAKGKAKRDTTGFVRHP
jgi:hypothetical protein